MFVNSALNLLNYFNIFNVYFQNVQLIFCKSFTNIFQNTVTFHIKSKYLMYLQNNLKI